MKYEIKMTRACGLFFVAMLMAGLFGCSTQKETVGIFIFETDVDLWGEPGPDPVFGFHVNSASITEPDSGSTHHVLHYDISCQRLEDEYEGDVFGVMAFFEVVASNGAAIDTIRVDKELSNGAARYIGDEPLDLEGWSEELGPVTLNLVHYAGHPDPLFLNRAMFGDAD